MKMTWDLVEMLLILRMPSKLGVTFWHSNSNHSTYQKLVYRGSRKDEICNSALSAESLNFVESLHKRASEATCMSFFFRDSFRFFSNGSNAKFVKFIMAQNLFMRSLFGANISFLSPIFKRSYLIVCQRLILASAGTN